MHVQHGAWTAESVAWPALHSRDIIVMGARDVALSRGWARHPEAEVHVLGQPRFDVLASLSRQAQRRYLEKLLAPAGRRAPARLAVWACQPFNPGRLKSHADLLLDGLAEAGGDWGLVIAPHPAQGADAFTALVKRDGGPPVAVVDPRVGARGCLAGADAVASAYSWCGIEAALLGIPVLEIGPPGEHTLGLTGHGLATRCEATGAVVVHLKGAPRPGRPAVSADRITPAQGHFPLFRHATFKITANGGGRHGRPDGGSVEFRCRRLRRAGGLGSPGAAGPGPVEAPSGDVRDPRIGTGGRGSAELVGPKTSAAWRRTGRGGEISAANSVSASAHRPSSSGRPRTRRRPTATSPPRSSSPRDRAPRPARWSPPRRRSSTEHPRRERSPGSPGGSAGDFLHRRWPGVPGSGRGPRPSP